MHSYNIIKSTLCTLCNLIYILPTRTRTHTHIYKKKEKKSSLKSKSIKEFTKPNPGGECRSLGREERRGSALRLAWRILQACEGIQESGRSLNREWRARRPSCGRRDGIFIGLNIGKPPQPIRNAIAARRNRRERERERVGPS